MFIRFVASILGLLLLFMPSLALAGKRLALVIGNGNYSKISKLKNPASDARLIAKTLDNLGFDVTVVTDANLDDLRRSLLSFGRKLREGDVEASLFYYAGHGIQVDGRNYVLPVTASLRSQDELGLEAIAMDDFVQTVSSAKSKFNILIFDACRNNPYEGTFRSATRGLARVNTPQGTYISFSAGPGRVAEDGDGDNSVFTEALSQSMATPGLSIEQVFKKTREKVYKETDTRQRPWDESSIVGDFYFSPKVEEAKVAIATQETPAVVTPAPIATDAISAARTEWQEVKDTRSIATLKVFIERHADTVWAAYASARLEELEALADPAQRGAPKADALQVEEETVKIKPKKTPVKQELVVETPQVASPEKQPATEVAVLKPQDPAKTIPEDQVTQEPENVDPATLARRIQERLKQAGCYRGRVDGIWGRGSRRALKAYIRGSGVKITGAEPSTTVLAALGTTRLRVCVPTTTKRDNSRAKDKAVNRKTKRTKTTRKRKTKPTARKRAKVQRASTRKPVRRKTTDRRVRTKKAVVRKKKRSGGHRACLDRKRRQGTPAIEAFAECRRQLR